MCRVFIGGKKTLLWVDPCLLLVGCRYLIGWYSSQRSRTFWKRWSGLSQARLCALLGRRCYLHAQS